MQGYASNSSNDSCVKMISPPGLPFSDFILAKHKPMNPSWKEFSILDGTGHNCLEENAAKYFNKAVGPKVPFMKLKPCSKV